MSLKSNTNKLVVGLVSVAFALGFAMPAQALTQAEATAIITALGLSGSQAAVIQALVTGSSSSSSSSSCNFTRDLTIGSTGDDVMCLQKLLNANGFTVSTSGAGSPGNESTYFGAKTQSALAKWQASKGITPSAGYLGPKTRAALASVSGPSTGPTTPSTGSGLSVMAASQPSASLAPATASRVPFTRVTLTASNDGDVVVNGVTVQRTGLAVDSVFSGIVLLDENGVQLGIAKTLNSNHQVTVGDAFVVKRGTSKTVTIAGNMGTVATLTSYAGQVASLSVIGVNTTATVNGSLPITGASHTINASLTLGTATLLVSSFDPNSTSITKNIGDTAVKFSGIRVTAGSAEAVRLWSVRFNQSGSAGSGDLANIKVYVDGTAYDATVSSDGKYYTATFGSGIVIDKGLSKDIYVQGDVIGSSVSGRTVQFDIYKNTDIYMTGETYTYGITPTPSGNTASAATAASQFLTSDGTTSGTASTPFYSASLITVNPGSATSIQKANTVVAQNIAVNVPNQILGGFTTDFRGEPVSVQSMVFTVATGTASVGLLTNVTIVDQNGAVVAGPIDGTWTTANLPSQTLTFTDTVTFPVGAKTYTIKGKVPSGAGNNATIAVTTVPSSGWTNITGQISGNSISLSGNGTFTMNTMTVKASSLALSLSTTPASTNIVAGGTGILFANVQLDASQSGEDMRISQIKLVHNGAGAEANLSTCQVYNGSTVLNTGSNVPTTIADGTATTFNFDNNLTIPKGTVVTLGLKCNVSSSATSNYRFDVTTAETITATGATSGNTLTVTPTAGTGGTMTVANGSLAVTLDSSSPSYSIAANGSTGVTLGVLRFQGTNEAINLSKIALQLSTTSGASPNASSTPSDLIQVTLWDGATQVGTVTFTGSNRTATSSLTSIVTVPKDGTKLITIKGDFPTLNAQAGLGTNAKPGAHVRVDRDGEDTTGTQGTGADSGSTINATGSDTAVAGVRVFKSYPIFTYSTTGATAQSGVNDLLTLNVQANSSGDVQLNKLTFTIGTTTATVTSPTFSGPNGAVNTTAITLTSSVLTVIFDNSSNTADRTISAGQTKTYTLRGTVTLTGSNTTGAVSTALTADTAYPSIATALMDTTANLTAANNIIWSPNSTTSVSTTNNDWTNGYGLPGCFTTSGLGQNCVARVISK